MCGFAGVIVWDERLRVGRDVVARMSGRVAHRGPDGEGTWSNHDDATFAPARPQARLAFRRLAILDPDPRAMQPFADSTGRRRLVFNGEIYNFHDLRAELTRLRPDYRWRTTGDTEVLMLAYEQWDERCVDKLNGMFAMAVWDDAAQSLLLARDRMGQKPLYYAIAPHGATHSVAMSGRVVRSISPIGAVAFASELAALREVPWVDADVNPDAVTDYLCYGYVPSPRTIYTGAVKLSPATTLRLRRTDCELQPYFDPNGRNGVAAGEDSVAATRRYVTQAVARQLVSDVPLGCFLSGGIDSSIVAAAMRAVTREAGQDVLTFSIGFDDARYDETPYAAEVARHLGTKHHEFKVRPDAAADLPRLAEVFGEPFGDSSALPTHYLARETRHHVKVALSGDGGDELFGGYDRYRATRAAERAAALPAFVRPLLTTSLWQKLLPGNHPKSLPARIKRFQSSLALAPGPRYVGYMRLFDDGAAASLVSRRGATNYHGHLLASRSWLLDEYTRLSRGRDVVQTATALDRVSYLPEDLLTKVDRASMLHALEVRSPFMDHDLVAFASRLSTSQLIDGGSKRLLREAFSPDLPKAVFNRRKMGFAVPIGDWLRGELKPMLHDHLFARDAFAATHFNRDGLERFVNEHERGTADHSQRLYALLMLELWWRTQR